ncbi:hypothetical protein AZE42_01835 [Rhizopogon vesiculosus]|uniref:Uncharacterized protein n=1 Tax=Rhizopogon vesiculosus TaxID=180088 RepID=A0A1J8QEK4_9AGAM|nr:hypothetical protein AZE42_01835 [Rhizopogon vesiculosus]
MSTNTVTRFCVARPYDEQKYCPLRPEWSWQELCRQPHGGRGNRENVF